MLGNKKREAAEKDTQQPKTRQKVTKDRWQAFMADRGTLEAELLYEMNKSRTRAWSVSRVMVAFALIAWGVCGFVLYRYSQPISMPLLTVNGETGVAEQTRLTTNQETYGEAVDSYFISQYVIHRETYNYYAQQSHYDATVLMSSGNVASEYGAMYGGKNGLDKQWGDRRLISVEISSIILNDEKGQATVRYTTRTQLRSRNVPEPPKHWIATISYEYRDRLMTVDQRYINPLGFTVTSFEKHQENAGYVR